MKQFAAVLILAGLAWPAGAQDYQKGLEAAKRGDFATVLHEWRPLAEQGNASAQYNLGVMYANGNGVPQDYAAAADWYRKAADQGHAEAENNLGLLYANGWGVALDEAAAAEWYRKAADQGLASAESNLGLMYASGKGVPLDYAAAAGWYRKAADQGLPSALNNLAVMYENGDGIRQDYVEAHKWYDLAAYRFSASNGARRDKAAHDRDLVAAKMTPAQIAEAQRLAREWKAAFEKRGDKEPAPRR